MYPQATTIRKAPFSYIAALYGNKRDKYESYINKQDNIVNKDDVFIVGDSLADLLSAQKIGATFIGTLTGLVRMLQVKRSIMPTMLLII